MKRFWKPLDVGGLRLYTVCVSFFNHPKWNETHIIAARSPTNAAEIYKGLMKKVYHIETPDVKGFALNVCQPEEWEEGAPCLECEPGRWRRSMNS